MATKYIVQMKTTVTGRAVFSTIVMLVLNLSDTGVWAISKGVNPFPSKAVWLRRYANGGGRSGRQEHKPGADHTRWLRSPRPG